MTTDLGYAGTATFDAAGPSASAKTYCVKKAANVQVTLTGSTGDWSKSIKAKAASIATFSDGYKIKVYVKNEDSGDDTKAAGTAACFMITTDNTTCFNVVSDGTTAKEIPVGGFTVKWLKKKEWEDNGAKKGAALWSIGTKLSEGTEYLVLDPKGDAKISAGFAKGAGKTKNMTATWYQPKETKDKKYKDKLARFSKGDKLKYFAAKVTDGKDKAEECSSGTALKGASALVAGAAVAFGAATLF